MKKIGVFDSGVGGKAIAESLAAHFDKTAEIMYVNDKEHMPYGGRDAADIIYLTDAAIQPLFAKKCDVIVLACNTATAAAIEALRKKYPNQLFIGLEPMIKPASQLTKSGTIAIFATPYTLSSERYKTLKKEYAKELTVLEPDCHDWAAMIEHSAIDDQSIETNVQDVLSHGADVIVLGCTHYHWIKEKIVAIAKGKAQIIDPSDAITKRVAEMLDS